MMGILLFLHDISVTLVDIQSWPSLKSGIEGNTLFVCIEITQKRQREDTMQIILGNHFNHNYTISSDLYYYNLKYSVSPPCPIVCSVTVGTCESRLNIGIWLNEMKTIFTFSIYNNFLRSGKSTIMKSSARDEGLTLNMLSQTKLSVENSWSQSLKWSL